MKNTHRMIILPLALCLAFAFAPASRAESEVDKQRKEAAQQAQPEVQKQKEEAQQKAEQSLDKEAIAAITETTNAVKAIAANNTAEALAAIERATGKIDILIARNSATALLPVDFEIKIIEAAPHSLEAVKERAKAAEDAVEDKAYPTARVLLDGLTSEIRIRTTHLPLATYPAAMKEAARLLDEKKPQEANNILLTALNTLAVIDRVVPLPLVLAKSAVTDAQALREKDKEAAEKKLAYAKLELERAKELGYTGKDGAYATLNKDIQDLEKQVKGSGDTGSLFDSLKDKVAALFKRESESSRP